MQGTVSEDASFWGQRCCQGPDGCICVGLLLVAAEHAQHQGSLNHAVQKVHGEGASTDGWGVTIDGAVCGWVCTLSGQPGHAVLKM